MQGYTEFELTLHLTFYAIKLIPLVFVGSFLANLLLEAGVTGRIARLIFPLLRAGRLPGEVSLPLVTIPLEPRVGHGMLASMLKSGVIGEREVFVSVFLVSPLAVIVFIVPRYYIPVIIPALGVPIALLYLFFTLACSFAKMFTGILYGRVTSKVKNFKVAFKHETAGECLKSRLKSWRVVKSALKSSLSLTKKVSIRTFIVVLALMVVSYFGVFTFIEKALHTVIGGAGLPARSVAIATTYAVSPIAGVVLAGAMLSKGEISCKYVLTGLLLGSILFRLVSEYPRHSFPFYASVYPVKLALKLTAVTIAVDLPVLLALLLAILLLM